MRRGDERAAEVAILFTARVRAPAQPILDRAIDVQELLADRGAHRGAPLQGLISPQQPSAHGVTLLHYDADFDLLASVTGQPCEWVVERGTVD